MATIRVDATTDAKGIQKLNALLGKSTKELEEMTKAGTKAEKAAKRLAAQADPLKRNEQQLAKLALETKKYGLNTDQAAQRAAQLERRLQGVGRAGKEATGSRAIQNIGAMAQGFLGVNAIVGRLSNLLTAVSQQQQQLAEQAIQGLPAKAKLAQLAGADSAKLRQLNRAADVTFGEGFVASRDASRNLAFELESANLLKERQFFSRLSLIGDAATIAQSVGKIRAGFAGGDPTGTAREIVSKAQAAASPLPGLSAGQVAAGAAKVSGLAKEFGATDEGTFAALSRVAQVFGQEGAARLQALLVAGQRKGFATGEGGIPGLVSAIENRKSTEPLVRFLGSAEAVQAFSLLQNQQAFRKRLAEVEAGAQGNLAGRSIRNELSDNRTLAAVLARRGEARNVLSQDALGVRRNLATFVREEMERFRRERGDSEFMNVGDTMMRAAREGVQGPEFTIREGEAMGLIPATGEGRLELLMERQTEIQQRQLDLMESGGAGRQE